MICPLGAHTMFFRLNSATVSAAFSSRMEIMPGLSSADGGPVRFNPFSEAYSYANALSFLLPGECGLCRHRLLEIKPPVPHIC